MNKPLCLIALLLMAFKCINAQVAIKGKIIDATTNEPIAAATIHCADEGCHCGCMTNALGEFEMKSKGCQSLHVSCIGYTAKQFSVSDKVNVVSLSPATSQLQEVVLSANRSEGAKRSEAPVAITVISSKCTEPASRLPA